MLLLCSATLQINNNDVDYHVFVEPETGRYFFKPTTYENRNIYPPSFWLQQHGATWEFEGITDNNLKSQAIEELSYCLNYSHTQASSMNQETSE